MDIKIYCFGNLERQIAKHLKQIQDRQKQRKIEQIKAMRYRIRQITFLNGNLPIVSSVQNKNNVLILNGRKIIPHKKEIILPF